MATHALFHSKENLPSPSAGSGSSAASVSFSTGGRLAAAEPGRSASVPAAKLAVCVAEKEQQRRMRRKMTRDQGAALERLGHAIDYLNDSHFYEGPDDDILDFRGAWRDAVQLLICAQRQLLDSLEMTEPRFSRMWNRLHRTS